MTRVENVENIDEMLLGETVPVGSHSIFDGCVDVFDNLEENVANESLSSGSIVREGCEAVRDGGDEGLLAVQGGMCLTVTNNLLCSNITRSSSVTTPCTISRGPGVGMRSTSGASI